MTCELSAHKVVIGSNMEITLKKPGHQSRPIQPINEIIFGL